MGQGGYPKAGSSAGKISRSGKVAETLFSVRNPQDIRRLMDSLAGVIPKSRVFTSGTRDLPARTVAQDDTHTAAVLD